MRIWLIVLIILVASSFCYGMSDKLAFTGFFEPPVLRIPALTIQENNALIKHLELNPRDITQEVLSKMLDLDEIESLKIWSWHAQGLDISNREFVQLIVTFFPELKHLILVTILDDSGFNELAESSLAEQLETLSLTGNMRFYITGATFIPENLNRFIKLRELVLKVQHRIDNVCFALLAESKIALVLEKLCICGSGITAAGLLVQTLEKFRRLEELHAGGILRTEEARENFIKSLKASLVSCRLKSVHVGEIMFNKRILDLIENTCYIQKR